MSIDTQNEIATLRQLYREDPRQSSFNLLLLGEYGRGKTFILRTARKPVFIDSFDPGGSKCLRKYIEKGDIIVDTRWEREDPMNPTAFATYKDHYHYQMLDIRTYVKKMLDLPCDSILTGHLELKQEGDSGSMKYIYATTGKGTYTIPTFFDEIWVASTKETSKGIEYNVLTESEGMYSARSRLREDGLLETREKPDIKHILAKAGMSTEDKEPL